MIPCSTELMYSRGMTPPLTRSSNTKPPPDSRGSMLMTTWPYCPRPPDCLTNLPHDFLRAVSDRLPVGHLWAPDIGLHDEFTPKPVDDDLEVQLTHTTDDGLARLLVRVDAKRRILIGQLDEPVGEFVLVDS